MDGKSFIEEKIITSEYELMWPYTLFGKKYKKENKYPTLPTCKALMGHETAKMVWWTCTWSFWKKGGADKRKTVKEKLDVIVFILGGKEKLVRPRNSIDSKHRKHTKNHTNTS